MSYWFRCTVVPSNSDNCNNKKWKRLKNARGFEEKEQEMEKLYFLAPVKSFFKKNKEI